jgi:alginate O-acetyltransferase complex protein AlgI
MLFNSPQFIIFFLVVFSLYWLVLRKRAQNILLLIASYIFYGFWSWKFLSLLLISTIVDYFVGLAIGKAETQRRKRHLLYISLLTNLGLLGTFKYAGFFISEAEAFLTTLGFQVHPHTLAIILPVGISFYTFQTLSYTIDIYRGKLKPTRNLLDFALFVSFFPQLVAGPIERATHLLPQVQSPRTFSFDAAASGIQLMFWGLFKKVVIADNLAPFVNAVYGQPSAYDGAMLATATAFFAFQIYCDFSGYSDIARGCARTLGFDISVNFRLPYFSKNPVEFWQRWHISLSTWFQDYLYFPLAMHYVRKGGWLAKYRAHIVAMTLIGLWHGANWTFILFGLYWGLVIAFYLVTKEFAVDTVWTNLAAKGLWRAAADLAAIAAMFIVACVGWVLFRAESMADFAYIMTHLFRVAGTSIVVGPGVWNAASLWLLVLGLYLAECIYLVWEAPSVAVLSNGWARLATRFAMIVPIILSYIVAQGTAVQPFIYFQF